MKKIAVIIVVVLMAQLTLAQGRMATYKPVPTFKNLPTYQLEAAPTRSSAYKAASTTLPTYKPAPSALRTSSSQEVQSYGGGQSMMGIGISSFRSTSKTPSQVAVNLTSSTRISGIDPTAHPTLGSAGVADEPYRGGVRRERTPGGDGNHTGTPGKEVDPEKEIPLGNGTLLLLMMMASYACVRARRARMFSK